MLKIFIDGASAGNPGPAGAGIFVNDGNGNNEHHAIPLGTMTNHEAEFAALLETLKLCHKRGWSMASINTDSKLVDEAVEKEHTKHSLYKPYLKEILSMFDLCELCFVKWIPSTNNRTADQLSKNAIKKNKSSPAFMK
ncbi:reverse transcriptase-like protein [Salibacterium salarium]|uniref:Reverse transcriptase-like protein n=1 Tax=Salibacterium salarium TaxID=284579 RepID=A0A3R9P2R8_9BACI|nr:reverse transcriptase-like protein [Salibacterium salarium]RSL29816.1 reverse transcriptase-like protein [Salibacterium salarium]